MRDSYESILNVSLLSLLLVVHLHDLNIIQNKKEEISEPVSDGS